MDILESMTLAQLRDHCRGLQDTIDAAKDALVDGRRGDCLKALNARATKGPREPFRMDGPGFAG